MQVAIIAVVGLAGTGKSAITEFISSKYDFERVYFGGVVLDAVREAGLEINQENERKMRESLRQRDGMAAIALAAYPRIETYLLQGRSVVIDGLYSTAEYSLLKQLVGNQLFLIASHVNKSIRYGRLSSRDIRPLDRKKVDSRDLLELDQLDKAPPIVLADFHVVNNGTLQQLQSSIVGILQEILLGAADQP